MTLGREFVRDWPDGTRRLFLLVTAALCLTQAALQASTDQFPSAQEVLDGRAFQNPREREIFFLQQIRQKYAQHWPALLTANISAADYEAAPDKLLRFVEELAAVTAGTDDPIAITNLAAIICSPVFYANTNAYRPEILRAAARAMVELGAKGRKALADAFSEEHYRTDPVTLELLAGVIGASGISDTDLNAALAAAAFTLTATNGGSYPNCTTETTRVLAQSPDGIARVAQHLKSTDVFKDPGRFQAVVDGIVAARASGLRLNLFNLSDKVASKLRELDAHRGPYYDDLAELQTRLISALATLGQAPEK
ncbi:MAG TPA: hypothetical protein VFE51_09895 [Verrucomicrobiae bacterium]|nr:hypothetical protein [Verrucomicrobiae bacterium]